MDQTGHRVTPELAPQVALSHNDGGTESLKWLRIFSSTWIGRAGKTLWHHPWLIAWLVVTLLPALAVYRWLDTMYSQSWHDDDMRLKLRKAIGLG